MRRPSPTAAFCFLTLLLAVLMVTSLYVGAASIPASSVTDILLGNAKDAGIRESWRYIVLFTRLPMTLTTVLTGAALSCAGLLMQSLFRNPLADPGILGISSGASLGVAIVMLAMGGSLAVSSFTLSGFMSVLLAAFLGAILVLLLILFLSRFIRSALVLLIAGIMIGYLASSCISILNFFASVDGVQSYVIWGLGNFTGVSMQLMPLYASVILLGLLLSLLLIKPLNAFNLGENYARNLGINVRGFRTVLLLISGLLAAITTAFCGPIAFIGLAVPHLARLVLGSSDYRLLLPLTMIMGSVLSLLCCLFSILPSSSAGILPINAVTPLVGAPVVLYVLLRGADRMN